MIGDGARGTGPRGDGAPATPAGGAPGRTGPVAAAALVSALVAGFVLSGAEFPHPPRGIAVGGVDVLGGAAEALVRGPWDWAVRLAPGLGLLVAAGVCVLLRSLHARRPRGRVPPAGAGRVPPRVAGWGVALAAGAVLTALVPVRAGAVSPGEYAAATVAMAVAAGALLGAAAQASHGRRWAMTMIVGGAMVSCGLARSASVTWAMDTIAGGAAAMLSSAGAAGSSTWWLPMAVLAVAIAAAIVVETRTGHGGAIGGAGRDRAGGDGAAGDGAGGDGAAGDGAGGDWAAVDDAVDDEVVRGRAPVAALLLLLVGAGYGLFELGVATGGWGGPAAALALSVLLFTACAPPLGEPGTLLPMVLAVAAVAAPVVAEVASSLILGLPVIVASAFLGLAAAVAGVRWPSVALGFALLLVNGVAGIVTLGDPATFAAFRLLLATVGGAYLLASGLVDHAAGVLVREPLQPWAGSGAGTGCQARPAVLAAGALFLTAGPAALAARVRGDALVSTLADAADAPYDGASSGVGVASLLTVAGCIVAYLLLTGRLRPPRRR